MTARLFSFLLLFIVWSTPGHGYSVEALNTDSQDERLLLTAPVIEAAECKNMLARQTGNYDSAQYLYDFRAQFNRASYVESSYSAVLNKVLINYQRDLNQQTGYSQVQLRVIFDLYVTEDTVTRTDSYNHTEQYCKSYLTQLISRSGLGQEYVIFYFGTAISKSNKQYPILIPVISAALRDKLGSNKTRIIADRIKSLVEQYNAHNESIAEQLASDSTQTFWAYLETEQQFNAQMVTDAISINAEVFGLTTSQAQDTKYTYVLMYDGGLILKISTQYAEATPKSTFDMQLQPQRYIDPGATLNSTPVSLCRFEETGASDKRQEYDGFAKYIAFRFIKVEMLSSTYVMTEKKSNYSPSVYGTWIPIEDFSPLLRVDKSLRPAQLPQHITPSYKNEYACLLIPEGIKTLSGNKRLSLNSSVQADELCLSMPVKSTTSQVAQPAFTNADCAAYSNKLKTAIATKDGSKIYTVCIDMKKPLAITASVSANGTAPESVEERTKKAMEIYVNVLSRCLTLDQRLTAINAILDLENVGNPYEKVILDFIRYTPALERNSFLNRIKTDGTLNKLIASLHDEGYGSDNFTACIDIIDSWLNYKSWLSNTSSILQKNLFRWKDASPDEIRYDAELSNGKVIISSHIQRYYSKRRMDTISAYDCIGLRLETVDKEMVSSTSTSIREDGVLLMSGLRFYWFLHKKYVERAKVTLNVTANGALFFIGIGEVTTAIKSLNYLRLSLAIVDLSMASADLYIQAHEKELNATAEGKNFLKTWTVFNILYCAGRVGYELNAAAKTTVKDWNQLRRTTSGDDMLDIDSDINKIRSELLEKGVTLTDNVSSFFSSYPKLNAYLVQLQIRLQYHTVYYRIERELKLLARSDLDKLEANPALLDGLNTTQLAESTDGVLAATIRGVLNNVNGDLFRGVTKSDFINTVSDFSNGANAQIADQAWDLWKQQKWSDLEDLFRSNNINFDRSIQNVWPPMFGFKSFTATKQGQELDNLLFDRFQKESILGGSYASPITTPNSVYSLSSRALGVNYDDLIDLGQNYYYFKFKIVNAPTELLFKYGEAAPWFNELGGAIQIKSSKGFHNLNDYIEIMEKWKFSNGQWIRIL